MTSQQILTADVIDILFEHRNKQYGAYQLRKEYHKQLGKAVVFAISFAILLCYFLPSSANLALQKIEKPDVIVHSVDLPPEEKKPEPPQQPKQAPAPQVRQEKAVDQFTIVNKEVVDPIPTQEILERAAISSISTPGADVGDLQPPLVPETKGAGNGAAKAPEPVKEMVPDKQPQFPGGTQAWIAFLSRHLQAPESLESGEKRTVLIRFYVAEDGSITNFQVVRSAGTVFDEEVIRVLKKMPKWAPAMQGGQPVPVSFTQPVTFVGLEE